VRAANLAPGRVVVSSDSQIDLLASTVEHRTQGVVNLLDGRQRTDPDSRRHAKEWIPFRLERTGLRRQAHTGREAVESYWFAL